MLTDTNLQSKVDQLWEKLWTGGLSNPMDAIEQFSFLLFLKRLDEAEDLRERQAKRRKEEYQPKIPPEIRWRHWTQMKADNALNHVKNKVFPWLKEMGNSEIQEGTNKNQDPMSQDIQLEEIDRSQSSFSQYMQTAEFKINKPSLLIDACKSIDDMKISEQNQDIQGDLYEYLLNKLSIAGRNGQFRTPRHIIRMMVEMVEPKPTDRIGDLAAGTCGFPVNAYQYILEKNTTPVILYDEEGNKNLVGDLLTPEEQEFLQTEAFTAYDNDSGMTMLRIGSMNLMLHDIKHPSFFYLDTLSKDFKDKQQYDLILMNPPFKGKIAESTQENKITDKSSKGKSKKKTKGKVDIGEDLPPTCTKSELLFLHLIIRVLDMGGRCADGCRFFTKREEVGKRCEKIK